MQHSTAFVDVLILLTAAVIAVPLFQKLRVGPVLGYLTAGAIIGPSALGLIRGLEDIRDLAELGVVFLLFAIGLELKLARLWVMRRMVFGLGSLQMLATAALIALIALLMGLRPEAAIIAGGGLALSSTAIVLQLLTDRGELTTRAGRAAFSVLLLQDLAVVPLLALVPMFGGNGASVPAALGLAALQAMGVLALILLAGRILLRPLLRLIAASHSSEIFAASAVLVVLGTAWLTAYAGMSMALGAFLAGLMLAETEFRHQIEADIQPFRGFLLGLFFMTVGMSVDLGLLVREAPLILLTMVALMALKAVLVLLLGRIFGLTPMVAIHTGLLLAQGGEFAFVLFRLAVGEGILTDRTGDILVLTVSLTMMLTPVLAAVAARLAAALAPHDAAALPASLDEAGILHDHVIIAGFGRFGQTVAKMLDSRHLSYVVLDLDAARVAEARRRGLPVFFADAVRVEVMRLAGAASARAIVVTLDHPGRAHRAVELMRHAFPSVHVYARARDRHHGTLLKQAGATVAVPETMEASLQLGATVLRSVGASPNEIGRLLDDLRANDYARLGTLIPEEKQVEKG